MTAWPVVTLGEVLSKSEEWIKLNPLEKYRQVTVKMWGEGVVERSVVLGQEIGSESRMVVHANQFLISRIDARNGASGLVPDILDGAVVSNDFPSFTVNSDRLDPRFFGWYSKTVKFVDDCKAASEGTTNRVRLKENRFLTLTVALPPLKEQRRIVERIQQLEEKARTARQIGTQIKQATGKLWMALARQLVNSVENASASPLGELVSLIGGGTPSKGNPEFWRGNIPWVSPKDMKVRTIRDSADHISESAIEGSAAKLIQPGAVLIVVRGMILAHTVPSAVLAVPATINQDMKAMLPKAVLTSEFLAMYLWAFNSELLAVVERSTHDTRKLETNKLLDFSVVVPSLEVQHSICNELRQLEGRVNQIADYRRSGQLEIEALMPSILNQAFSGKL